MTTREAKKELKNHCIAIAAIMAQIKKQYPKAEKISVSMNATDDGYATFNVVTKTGKVYKDVMDTYNVNVLKEKWLEHEPFEWTDGEEAVG